MDYHHATPLTFHTVPHNDPGHHSILYYDSGSHSFQGYQIGHHPVQQPTHNNPQTPSGLIFGHPAPLTRLEWTMYHPSTRY